MVFRIDKKKKNYHTTLLKYFRLHIYKGSTINEKSNESIAKTIARSKIICILALFL